MTFTKIYIRNPFRQEPERIFYAIKRILRMAPSGTMEITCGLVLMKNRDWNTAPHHPLLSKLNPNRSLDPTWFYLFIFHSFSRLFVSIGLFLSDFLDIARYTCKETAENTPNIKQKYRLSPNTLFWIKRDRSSERRYLFSFMIIIRPTYPLYCRQ